MDIDEEELQDEFSTFGVSIENEDIIFKLKTLCQMHRLDASQIAMEWVAFSNNKNNCKLTQEHLDILDRERLQKKVKKPVTTPGSVGKKFSSRIHSINTIEAAVADTDDAILDSYATPKGKSVNKRIHSTPESAVNKRLTGVGGTPAVLFSPGSFSPSQPSPNSSKKYGARTNAGEVLCSFGPNVKVWRSQREKSASVSPFDRENALTSFYKYMFQKLTEKSLVLNDIIETLGSEIHKDHKLEEEYGHVSLPAQDEVTIVGRICCDSQGKLNAKSVLLEGSRQTSGGKRIAVDLSELKQYALFPGQIIAMKGINSMGNKFVAKKLLESLPPPLPANKEESPRGPLNVVIAAGPFSTSDNLTFEPLADLIKVIKRETPDVCILLGPILDIKNPEVENGKLEETYEEMFQRTVDQICNLTSNLETRLVFVPSYRDAHHHPVYPQPPYSYSNKSDPRLHFVSDPCVLDIDGLVVALTSTDVLLQLGTEELSYPPGSSDRLARLTKHLLSQRSFYPSSPPAEDVHVDYPHYEHYAMLPVFPHVLVTPSDLRYFLKDVNHCCCVNPGRLAKGQIGGSFAKLMVHPAMGNETKPVIERISAQIVRI